MKTATAPPLRHDPPQPTPSLRSVVPRADAPAVRLRAPWRLDGIAQHVQPSGAR
ncbi:hypothetical protein [Haladaptatus sp. W1]|uniref:hypothetical protein n=1 Tax=Haladaptatus sp. W1 TaxID=1897478 RepID=UPI001585E591|nr:hypothetical protein [Haladaptatus sp. W1]